MDYTLDNMIKLFIDKHTFFKKELEFMIKNMLAHIKYINE